VSPGLGTQPCPFCGKVPQNGTTSSGRSNTEEIALTGDAANRPNLVITDDAGHKLGYVNGKFVDQIHGGSDDPVISGDWSNRTQPDFFVPADKKYTVTLDGAGLSAPVDDSLTIVGPSYDLSVSNIRLQPGEKDVLIAEPDATHLSYNSTRAESPTFTLGVSDNKADYSFVISGVSDRPGSTLNVALPAEGGTLAVQNVGASTQSTLTFKMTRSTPQGTQTFNHPGIVLASTAKAQFAFGGWTGSGQLMPLTISHGEQRVTQQLDNQAG
jgi:hypothetical protein